MRWAIVLLAATQTNLALSLSGTSPLGTWTLKAASPRSTNLFGPVRSSRGNNFGREDAAPAFRIDGGPWCPAHSRRRHPTSLPSAVVMGGGTELEKDSAETSPVALDAVETPPPAGRRILVTKSSMNKCFAFLAGVADVLCSNRHECYANMMTGNTVKFATAVAEVRPVDAAFSAAVLTSYVAGFGAYRAADRLASARRARRSTAAAAEEEEEEEEDLDLSPTPVVVAPAILAVFALYDALWWARGGPSGATTTTTRWIVPILAAASGTVNAAGAEATGAVTCMMTGNLQKVANYVADAALRLCLGGPKANANLREGARKSAGLVGWFAAGIATAAAAVRLGAVGRRPFTVLGGVYALLLVTFDRPVRLKSPRAVWKRISWGLTEDAAEPCELDKLESECSDPQE